MSETSLSQSADSVISIAIKNDFRLGLEITLEHQLYTFSSDIKIYPRQINIFFQIQPSRS